jgi:hypothetical protein
MNFAMTNRAKPNHFQRFGIVWMVSLYALVVTTLGATFRFGEHTQVNSRIYQLSAPILSRFVLFVSTSGVPVYLWMGMAVSLTLLCVLGFLLGTEFSKPSAIVFSPLSRMFLLPFLALRIALFLVSEVLLMPEFFVVCHDAHFSRARFVNQEQKGVVN